MASQADAFQSLEEEFVDNKIQINQKVNEIVENTGGSTTQAAQYAHAHVVEAQRILKRMNIELRGKAPKARKEMQSKINMYRTELQGLTQDLERAQLMATEANTKNLRKPKTGSHYERIMDGTDRLMASSKKLEDSQRLVSETEEIGISVLDTLSEQRESLLRSHDKVRETRETTSEARRILQRMTRRIITNTIVLYTVILILLTAIAFVLYRNFIHH